MPLIKVEAGKAVGLGWQKFPLGNIPLDSFHFDPSRWCCLRVDGAGCPDVAAVSNSKGLTLAWTMQSVSACLKHGVYGNTGWSGFIVSVHLLPRCLSASTGKPCDETKLTLH